MKYALGSAFFAVLTALCCCPTAVVGHNLYPSCGGNEQQGSANAGREATVYTIPKPSVNITLTCLAFEVSSLKGGLSELEDPCRVAHQTDYHYRLVLRASYENPVSRARESVDYDVKDILGGSLSNIAIRMPHISQFTLVIINQGKNSKCTLGVRAIMDYTSVTEETSNSYLPVVIGITPHTVYTNRTALTQFALRYPKGTNMETAKGDSLSLVNLASRCSLGSGFPTRLSNNAPSPDAYEDMSTVGLRDYYFDKPEAYRLCYQVSGNSAPAELAVVGVFDGNPSYYQVVSGQDDKGHVTVGVVTTIKFFGYDLDTRPGGDSAKFVGENEACASGVAAGGVPAATDLGPSDDYGPKTTYTLWTWTLLEGGAFKVCYRRRNSGWTEVPSIGEAGPNPQPVVPPNGNIPRPTDPINKADCPMAPANTPQKPWLSFKSMKLTLQRDTIPDLFLHSFSRKFCIPRAALSVVHKSHNEKGKQVIYLGIYCEDLEPPRPCDTMERQNYIIDVAAHNMDILKDIEIAEVEGSKHMFARGDDVVVVKGGGHVMAVLIVSATLIAVTGLVVYGVLKYREKREYFIQFGMDEGNVEDMYVNEAPFDGNGENGRRTGKNAVIEVED